VRARTAPGAAARAAEALCALVLAAVVLAGCAPGPRRVVAREDGHVVAALPLDGTRTFDLTYRHSVYDVPAREEFAVLRGGGFRLVAVASPQEAVLDYYALPGSRAAGGDGWWRLELADPPVFRSLPVAATAIGERALVVGDDRAPLAAPGRDRPVVVELVPSTPQGVSR